MTRRHPIASLLLAMSVVSTGLTIPTDRTSAQAADGSFALDQAVVWKPDYDAREITATVSMAFYRLGCDAATACAASSPQFEANVAAIVNAITTYWNGFNFKCFKFIVKVNARTVASQAEAGPKEIDIGLDDTPMSGIYQFVNGEGDHDAYLSDKPADRVIPQHSVSAPSTWAATGEFRGIWAHEFGHVLGLADNYVANDHKQLRPGASPDLMFASRFGVVSQDMVNRVVRRSGKVDESLIHCDNAFEATLTATQHDHMGLIQNITYAPADQRCPPGLKTYSADQAFTVRSQRVRIDAVELKDPPVGWGDQVVVFVPHGAKFSPYLTPNGMYDFAPILFSMPSTVDADRSEHRPGLAPMPADAYDQTLACALGGGGGPPPITDCGAKRFDVAFDIRAPQPNKLYPYPQELPDDVYHDCGGGDVAPGMFVSSGQTVRVEGGDFPTFEVLDPGINKIVILGKATMLDRGKGSLTTQDLTWTLTLCRIVNDKPAC